MKKLKVLFVDHTPFVGGAQLCLANHLKYLDHKKIEPYLLIDKSSKFESIYVSSKVKIYKIEMGKLKKLSLKLPFQLSKTIQQFNNLTMKLNPDVVVANSTRGLIIASLGKKDFKLVSYIRDYDYPKWLMRVARARVDKFLTVSKSINNFYGGKGKKFEVVYLGSDLFKKSSQVRESEVKLMRKKWDISERDLVVGYVGRLVLWKGVEELLEAFSKIDQSNVKLLIFGSGKGQEGSIEENLKYKILNLKLAQRVKMMGYLTNQALIYKLINIFVLPSKRAEPFATNIIEAAQSRLAIIGTHIGGTGEFIKNNVNGILIKPGDSVDLAEALLRLIKDRGLRKQLSEKAYKDSLEFTEEKLARNLEKIYQEIVNQ